MDRFPTKHPEEELPVTFDFTKDLETGETVASVVEIDVTVVYGSDENPADILYGSPSVVTPRVAHWVTGGLDQTDYLLEVTVETSMARKLTAQCVLPVRERL